MPEDTSGARGKTRAESEPELDAEPQEYVEALEGLDFPASKDAIVRRAMDHGGLDREVQVVLRHIEDRSYRSMDDLQQEIARVYGTGGGVVGGGPAAPP